MSDPGTLERFLSAQAGSFDTALAELRAGRKRSHWMWFVFPQMRGLGRSETASFYGVASLEEARAYLKNPTLSARLRVATAAALEHRETPLDVLFGQPDDAKFCSCMTLFHMAAPEDPLFAQALAEWGMAPDPRTVAMCGA